ncbi:MAG: GAF domain-containing protein [Myxococcales bacterium]|nr:GAF domain-containing protein [Myxococcales bacterium]
MTSWSVTARGRAGVQVQGRNWLVALGRGLEEMGCAADVSRLAAEVLPNGTVIARDIASGAHFVVQGVDVAPEAPSDLVEEPEEPELLGEAPDTTTDEDESEVELLYAISEETRALLQNGDGLDQVEAAPTQIIACELALHAALTRVSAESGAVVLADRGYLKFFAVSGPGSRKLMGVRLPRGTGVAGYAMENARTVVLGAADQDPKHVGEMDALSGYVTKQIAVVPVAHGDEVFGAIELMNLTDAAQGRFLEVHIAAVEEVARALGARLAQ